MSHPISISVFKFEYKFHQLFVLLAVPVDLGLQEVNLIVVRLTLKVGHVSSIRSIAAFAMP
jgi:hypothetical protein